MADIITREQQVLFLNSTRIRGVKNANLQYQINSPISKSIGSDSAFNGVSGPQIGQLSVNLSPMSNDQILSFTGDVGVNGYLLKNKNESSENYSFLSGYLTNYSSRCSVGEIPEISANFQVFGNIGRIDSSESSDFGDISSSQTPELTKTSFEDFTLSLDGFRIDRVISYDININSNRRPDYTLGSRFPRRVSLNWPIEASITFVISAAEYNAFNIRNFPHSKRVTDVSLTFKNKDDTSLPVLSYFFHQMILVSESWSSGIDEKSTVTLSYRSFVSKNKIASSGLVLYLNASNLSSYQSDDYIKDLTFNKYNYSIANNIKSPSFRHIGFNGSSSSMERLPPVQYKMTEEATFCFWVCLLGSLSGIKTIVSWGDAGENALQFNYVDTTNPFAVSLGSGSAVFDLGPPISNSVWTFFTVTIDNINENIKSYINGEFFDSVSSNGYNLSNMGHLIIGTIEGGGDYFQGSLNKMMLYNRILTEEEIFNNYKATVNDTLNLALI